MKICSTGVHMLSVPLDPAQQKVFFSNYSNVGVTYKWQLT